MALIFHWSTSSLWVQQLQSSLIPSFHVFHHGSICHFLGIGRTTCSNSLDFHIMFHIQLWMILDGHWVFPIHSRSMVISSYIISLCQGHSLVTMDHPTAIASHRRWMVRDGHSAISLRMRNTCLDTSIECNTQLHSNKSVDTHTLLYMYMCIYIYIHVGLVGSRQAVST